MLCLLILAMLRLHQPFTSRKPLSHVRLWIYASIILNEIESGSVPCFVVEQPLRTNKSAL